MVEYKTVGLVLCILVLLSIVVVALPFIPAKAAKAVNKDFQPTDKQTNEKPQTSNIISVSKITGKITTAIVDPNSLTNPRGPIVKRETFGYLYGEGDLIYYHPTATASLHLIKATWWSYAKTTSGVNLYPYFEQGGFDWLGASNGEYGNHVNYGPCLTSQMESSEFTAPSSGLQPGETWSQSLEIITQGVVSDCTLLQVDVYRSTCVDANLRFLGTRKWLNPSDTSDQQVIRANEGGNRYGEFAWCNFDLSLTQPLVVTVVNATGSVTATWETDMLAANDGDHCKITFNKLNVDGTPSSETNVLNCPATSRDISTFSKQHTVTGVLAPGTYKVNGHSCTVSRPLRDGEINSPISNCVDFKYEDASGREKYIALPNRVDTPVITFMLPTPDNAATLSTNTATIRVSSNIPITIASIHLTKPDGISVNYEMTMVNPTVYAFTLSDLQIGTSTYHVEATSESSGVGVS
ncbi:MAG: hypothetical protein V1644_01820, partial [Candidatus Micrarchaeota archaeon]